MPSSNSPSVDGFVSMRPAVRSFTFPRRSSRSRVPRASVSTFASEYPAIATLGGVAPGGGGGGDARAPLPAAVREVPAHEHEPGELTLRSCRRLQGHRGKSRHL